MYMTVKELLEMEAFKDSKLLAGKKGLSKQIKHINAMEIPDISPWLSEGELLITTGYSIKGDHQALKDLILGLNKAKSAALAIKTKFIGPIDQSLLDLADQLKIPIILIPDDLSFVSITTPIIESLIEKQKKLRRHYEEIHKLFIDLELNREGFQGISDMISRLIKLPCIISDPNFKVLASTHSSERECQAIRSLYNFDIKMLNKIYSNTQHLEEVNISNYSFILRKVFLREKICAFIFINISKENKKDIPGIVLDHASTVVALEQSKKEAILEYNSTLDNMFFVDIMSENVKSIGGLKTRAQALKWPKLPYLALVFNIENFSQYSLGCDELKLHNIKMDIVKIIKCELSNISEQSKVFIESDNFFCLLSMGKVDTFIEEKINEAIGEVIEKVENKLSLKLHCGISNPIEDFESFKAEFNNAKSAMYITQKIYPSKNFHYIRNLYLEEALLQSSSQESFEKYVETMLGSIRDYDLKNNSDLLNSLNEYILTGENATAAANNLYIHRNTLNYRLNQIQDLTGYNFSNPQTMIDLTLAFRINKVLNIL